MSRRVLVTLGVILLIIALGLVFTLKRALKASASHADPDSGPRPPATAPR
jgi:predicted Kef-type K+ transport protein